MSKYLMSASERFELQAAVKFMGGRSREGGAKDEWFGQTKNFCDLCIVLLIMWKQSSSSL